MSGVRFPSAPPHLATKLTFEGSVSLDTEVGEVSGPGEMGMRPGVPDQEALSEIIARLNERYGTDFDPADRLILDGMIEEMAAREEVQQAAVANDSAAFRRTMTEPFQAAIIDQMDVTQDIAKQYLDNTEFAGTVLDAYMPLLQTKAKVAHQHHCPIRELLARGKDSWSEFKSTFRVDSKNGEKHKGVETAALKSVAAFLNSYDGGTLLLG